MNQTFHRLHQSAVSVWIIKRKERKKTTTTTKFFSMLFPFKKHTVNWLLLLLLFTFEMQITNPEAKCHWMVESIQPIEAHERSRENT